MRTRPYTDDGLRRVPCAHCGAPSAHQWHVRACAAGGPLVWRGLCTPCDLELNRLVLDFFRVPDAADLLAAYAASGEVAPAPE